MRSCPFTYIIRIDASFVNTFFKSSAVGYPAAVITASAAMIACMIGEGFVDAARLQSSDVSDSADNSETVKK